MSLNKGKGIKEQLTPKTHCPWWQWILGKVREKQKWIQADGKVCGLNGSICGVLAMGAYGFQGGGKMLGRDNVAVGGEAWPTQDVCSIIENSINDLQILT